MMLRGVRACVKALLAVSAATLLASCATAAVITAANDRELAEAISRAQPGDVIELTGRSYALVNVFGKNFARPVRIVSRDPAAPATVRRVRVSGSSGVEISDVSIGGPLQAGERDWTKAGEVYNSNQVRFARVKFHGSLDGDPGNDGWGLFVRDCSDITVEDSTFTEFFRAVVFERDKNIRLLRNSFDRIRSDGSNFAGVQNVVIDGNRFSNFFPIGQDHADAIQFWTTHQTQSSTDIVITNNVILPGEGAGIQGIFMRDEQKRFPYQRVRISNNLLYGSDQWHGIAIGNAEDVEVVGNTVVSSPEDKKVYWIAVSQVRRGRVEDNVTDRLSVSDNEDVQVDSNSDFSAGASSRKIPNLRAGRVARPEDLIFPGKGYRPVAAQGGLR